MNRYVCYTAEGYTVAPNGEDIDNCQILGFVDAEDRHDAIEKLLKRNPWIEKYEFTTYDIVAARIFYED